MFNAMADIPCDVELFAVVVPTLPAPLLSNSIDVAAVAEGATWCPETLPVHRITGWVKLGNFAQPLGQHGPIHIPAGWNVLYAPTPDIARDMANRYTDMLFEVARPDQDTDLSDMWLMATGRLYRRAGTEWPTAIDGSDLASFEQALATWLAKYLPVASPWALAMFTAATLATAQAN